MIKKILPVIFTAILLGSCSQEPQSISVSSPSKNNRIQIIQSSKGRIGYAVFHDNAMVLDTSWLSFDLYEADPIGQNLMIQTATISTHDDTWPMPWGEQTEVRNHYTELQLVLQETDENARQMELYFRAYDDGVAFRYAFPEQEGIDSLKILEENTEFSLTGDHTAWWIPGDWDIYEHLYTKSKVSEIDALSKRDHPDLAATYIPNNAVNTPVTLRTGSGIHLSFHEANLTDYSGMTLGVDKESLQLKSILVGSENRPYKVSRALPFATPWRMVQIADQATDLIDSRLVVNLNEPNKLGDVSWIEPKKYVGIWWEMHMNTSRWDYGMTKDTNKNWIDTGKAHGKHGATTANTKRYIDFAAANGIKGVLVEGWNTGWEEWIGFEDREGVFDFVTSYPDYDLEEVTNYAKERGVEIIMHHETSSAVKTYEQQMDTAYALMKKYGIGSVKTGYVGKIIPKGEYHHGQWMVNHYRKVLETAAKYQIAINAHEPIKATGIRRTYPNAISREGLRGQEFNAWSSEGGNPVEHLPIVAFTRMLAGPIDFTPGVFDIMLQEKPDNRVNTTLAQQLALYVVLYSPIQMACDFPENYEGSMAFGFIRDVAVDWEKSITLNGEVGEYVTIARKERNGDRWFVGSITDAKARDIVINFDFLMPNQSYRARLYQDGRNADYKTNPNELQIEERIVNSNSMEFFKLASGGGLAISLTPIEGK
ncbi:glycoside hydrolase family 97 protein [Aureicoccus marinus]|uniref:Alpha-glucosidase n=1 Tax=Aureicoccus marinus TaxID=754435 RepID=A0A2S7TAE4_9FLAO|nr:glycoside hydrolase family 97 protein [Aureicoccus marinus]PQJ16477.1 alpha-glucosidase [Aureicoccus marinus]